MQEVFDTYDLPLFPWHVAPKPRFVRIEPESVTGLRFHVVDAKTWDTPSLVRTAPPPSRPRDVETMRAFGADDRWDVAHASAVRFSKQSTSVP